MLHMSTVVLRGLFLEIGHCAREETQQATWRDGSRQLQPPASVAGQARPCCSLQVSPAPSWQVSSLSLPAETC